jgi:hypothetical protein
MKGSIDRNLAENYRLINVLLLQMHHNYIRALNEHFIELAVVKVINAMYLSVSQVGNKVHII